jgi:hypothetical protein
LKRLDSIVCRNDRTIGPVKNPKKLPPPASNFFGQAPNRWSSLTTCLALTGKLSEPGAREALAHGLDRYSSGRWGKPEIDPMFGESSWQASPTTDRRTEKIRQLFWVKFT